MTKPDSSTAAARAFALDENDARFSTYTRERIQYWGAYARNYQRWRGARAAYQKRLREIYTFLIPPGMRVLEVGCGRGDMLAALKPSYGVGIDFCPEMIEAARESHPDLNFVQADAHGFDIHDSDRRETFDYIVCLDLVNDVWDVQRVFEKIALHCHPGTRVILNAYSRLWELPRRMAEAAGLAPPQLTQNWLAPGDIGNLLNLAGFDLIRTSQEVLWPFGMPVAESAGEQVSGEACAVPLVRAGERLRRAAETGSGARQPGGQRGGGGAQ